MINCGNQDQASSELIGNDEQIVKELEFFSTKYPYIARPDFFTKEYAWQPQNFDIDKEERSHLFKRAPEDFDNQENNTNNPKIISMSYNDVLIPSSPINKESIHIKNQILYQKVLEAFNLKPIWLKNSLLDYLKANEVPIATQFSLKKVLSYVAYLFKNGPWKFTYIKFGYDPRIYKEAVKWQAFSIGVANKKFLERQEDQIDYRSRNYGRMQVCELDDEIIKECLKHTIIDNEKDVHKICNEKTGWFDKKVYSIITKKLRDNLKRNYLREQREMIQQKNFGRSGSMSGSGWQGQHGFNGNDEIVLSKTGSQIVDNSHYSGINVKDINNYVSNNKLNG